ncbi:MAG TPA: phage major capsid protein [Terriglobia bacterium]|nr:phage major capsid protein [Terriglobia bacterium]
MPESLVRESLLAQAHRLINSPKFDHESGARANALLSLADRVGSTRRAYDDPLLQGFERALRAAGRLGDKWSETPEFKSYLRELRDMGESTGNLGGYFVPQGFRDMLQSALKAYDRIFDPDVSTWFESERGGTCAIPAMDDTASVAVQVGEGQQTTAQDVTAEQVLLNPAIAWRSGVVKFSIELLQDSCFRPLQFLADAFAKRFARAVGPTFITSLLASAKLGCTATGSSKNTGGSETGGTSIGTTDLVALRTSVNSAYRTSPRCWWLMNDDTLSSLDSILDKNGHPIIHPHYDQNGNRLLLGYPVGICPSIPGIAPNATPILFGNFGFFIVRNMPQETKVQVSTERFADYGQVAFQGYLRVNGGLTCVSSADAPVKYLQNASS